MKKIFTIFILFSILFCFSACNSSTQQSINLNNDINIITTIFPPYDFVSQIGGDNVNVQMLLKAGQESHSYEPTPQDIKSIQNADLFIYVGGENDFWIEEILNSMRQDKPDTLKLVDIVPILQEEIIEGMEHSHDEEHEEEEGHSHDELIDEHIWTSPKNCILIVEKITEILCEKDSNNLQNYLENSQKYIQKLNELDNQFREVVSNGIRNTIIFGDRFPFIYFAKEYGLNYYAAFSGCSTETEASPRTISFLIDKVKQENIPVVFTIEFSNGKIADSIVDSTGAIKMFFHSCHNLTKEELEQGETYLSLMKKNLQVLKEALN